MLGTASAVTLYQAPQSAHDLGDIASPSSITAGRSSSAGGSEAKAYFEELDFVCPPLFTRFLVSLWPFCASSPAHRLASPLYGRLLVLQEARTKGARPKEEQVARSALAQRIIRPAPGRGADGTRVLASWQVESAGRIIAPLTKT